jgi:hypothetical protein
LSFLAFIDERRHAVSAADWGVKFGRARARITEQILPAFTEAVVASARSALASDPAAIYLPPEARL